MPQRNTLSPHLFSTSPYTPRLIEPLLETPVGLARDDVARHLRDVLENRFAGSLKLPADDWVLRDPISDLAENRFARKEREKTSAPWGRLFFSHNIYSTV